MAQTGHHFGLSGGQPGGNGLEFGAGHRRAGLPTSHGHRAAHFPETSP